jgi:beta-phosphoglucomutase-like phosphatase (HAD superfamily)
MTSDKFDAVLFDLDGVITATAKVHAKCWKKCSTSIFRSAPSRRASIFNLLR